MKTVGRMALIWWDTRTCDGGRVYAPKGARLAVERLQFVLLGTSQ